MYDVIVVGAGIVGSSTAYHLIKNGAENVLLLEQFSLRHTRGSSHGSSRITRRGYSDPIYTPLMDEAYKLWEKIEKESGTELYINTGYLLFGPKDHKCITRVIQGLQASNAPHEIYTGEEAMRRYPNQLRMPPNYRCVYDQDGGILLAAKALEAFQKLFLDSGGVLLDNQQVTQITPGHVITLKTASGDIFQARKLVITAGAWATKIMRTLGVELPLEVITVDVLYWEVTHPMDYSWESFPVFANYTEEDEKYIQCYGMPVCEFPGLLKVCLRGGTAFDPDHPDMDPTHGPHSTDVVSSFIIKHFMNISTSPAIHESCLFTCTPDYHPILDRHPLYHNIVVGAGFTGHGFKLSPATGKVLSELALDMPPTFDVSPFKMDRFKQQSML